MPDVSPEAIPLKYSQNILVISGTIQSETLKFITEIKFITGISIWRPIWIISVAYTEVSSVI